MSNSTQRYITQTQQLAEISRRLAAGADLADIVALALDGIIGATQAVNARLILDDTAEVRLFAAGREADALNAVDEPIHRFCHQVGTLNTHDVTIPLDGLDLSSLADMMAVVTAAPLDVNLPISMTLWVGLTVATALDDDTQAFLDALTAMMMAAVQQSYQAEVARVEHEQLRALLANDLEPIVIVDTQSRIRVFNPAAVSLFRTQFQDVLNRPFDEMIDSYALQEMLHAGADAPKDVEFMAGDGRTFSPHVTEIRADDGTLRGWLLVLRDVTRFKRLSENMSNFLHTVSHDIRSPLTAAKGFVDMMSMVGPLNEKQQRFIDKTLTSINDMTNLVEKVLDAGRLDPEMDAYEIRREACDPETIVNKVVSTLAPTAENRNISLVAEVSPGLPIMNIDELMTERAMLNLVENAIKYTPEGGEVRVQARVENNHLVLAVQDNGLGIAPTDQKRLFERGQRVHRQEHKGIRGSGLGLFIVRNVARKHRGTASVVSEVGEGSTFYITIPLIAENMLGSSLA